VTLSNPQQAVPLTFGFKMARLLATFERHKQSHAEIKSCLLVSNSVALPGHMPLDFEALKYYFARAERLLVY
jgi:adenylosuccinate lyase